MNRALSHYNSKINEYNNKLKLLENRLSNLALVRGIIFIITVVGGYYIYKNINLIYSLLFIILGTLTFILFVFKCNGVKDEINKVHEYIKVNKDGIARIDGSWRKFKDNGEEYLDLKHNYINDLDIFGKNSLFQLINSTRSKFGRKKLVDKLKLKNSISEKEVIEVQESIKELGEKVDFRQKLYVEGTIEKSGDIEVDDLLAWGKGKSNFKKIKVYVAYLFIGLTLITLFLAISKKVPISFLILELMINFIVIKILTKDLSETIELFIKHRGGIESYKNMLEIICDEKFNSKYINNLMRNIKGNSNREVIKELNKLKEIIDWMGDSSGNAYYLIINVVMFVDVFIVYNLEAWRMKNGKYLENWLEIMGEIEALSSISNLYFDYDEWAVPEISDRYIVEGKNIGHPLLNNKAVVNDYSLSGNQRVTIITGSNMSGKSTFLRTIGLNLILAYIGAPVYAKEFKCGIFSIYTCMRTADNLEESISSFYAEILRIKLLIESSKKGEKIFFLLDEIFKGTNSKDRHEGARVLINQLIKFGAVGLVSTHDLELCQLEEIDNRIVNYNFREYYEDGKIKFDYKLRNGRSTTQNAIHLMKLAGIDFEE